MAAKDNPLTKAQAEALWMRVWDAMADCHKAIVDVIENRAWEPIGHESFTDAWYATQRNTMEIDKALRPHVVYQMITEGLTSDEIAEAVIGIGPASADRLKQQKKNGVPADQASTTADIKAHPRLTRPHTLHVYIGAEDMEEFHRIAARHDQPVLGVALEAIRKRFRELGNELDGDVA